jgi:acyl dehydratase
MAAREISIEELKTLTGQDLGVSGWLELTQEMIDQFAALTHDPQWIHIDRERARTESPFGTTIAHGFLTLSLLSYLTKQAVRVTGPFRMGINYGFNRVRFPAPVPSGARIRSRVGVQSVKEIEGGHEIVWDVRIEAENAAKPSVAAEWISRLYG